MNARKSHLNTENNQLRLTTIEEHRSEEDQNLQRIVSTSPIRFPNNQSQTQPVNHMNQLNSLNQVQPLFDQPNPIQLRSSVQTTKISQHRRNKTQMSANKKNKLKDPIFNALFVPFLQTKSFDFGKSFNSNQKNKTPKRKVIINPKNHSHSFSGDLAKQKYDQEILPNQKSHRYSLPNQKSNLNSQRGNKVSLPGIQNRKAIRSSIQIIQQKKNPVYNVKASTALKLQSRQSVQKIKDQPERPFITTTSIGKIANELTQKDSSFRLPIQAKNLRDFKAKDRQNKLNSKKKSHKEKQWKQVNYFQLKTSYYHIDKKIASATTMAIDSNIKSQQSTKNKDLQFKGLKKDLLLHQRMPKIPKLPQIIEQVSLIIKNFHSIRKNKISIDKLIKSKYFSIKFVEKHFLYFGQILNQKFHGYGILIKPDYLFQGEWKEGQKITGAQCKKGIFFQGDFVQNKKIGFGVSYWNNGYDQYSGQWKDGLKNGNGIWKNLDGDQYIGQWVNGKVQGFGVHTTGDGQKYEGFFSNFLKQGKGKQSFLNGDQYEGNFLEGKPSGYGVYKFYRTQAVYEGNFQKGLRHGQGKFIVPNNFQYKGQFIKDSVSGYGKVTYMNNDCYIGNFRDGLRHGKGSFHKIKQRTILNGYWNNGEYFEKQRG